MTRIFIKYCLVLFLLLNFGGGTFLPFLSKAENVVVTGDKTEAPPAGSSLFEAPDPIDYPSFAAFGLSFPDAAVKSPSYADAQQSFLPVHYLSVITPPPDLS